MVHIDRPSAVPAGPALPLGFDKIADAMFPDRLKVPDHAHVISRPVTLVQLPEPSAGILGAGMTVSPTYLIAGGDRAVPVTPPVRRIAPIAPVLFTEKRRTDGTVHPAGCYQRGPEQVLRRHCRK